MLVGAKCKSFGQATSREGYQATSAHLATVDGRNFASNKHKMFGPVFFRFVAFDVYQGIPGPSPRLLDGV